MLNGKVKNINKDVMARRVNELIGEMSETGVELCGEGSYDELLTEDRKILDQIRKVKEEYIGDSELRIMEILDKHEDYDVRNCYSCWKESICNKCYELELNEERDTELNRVVEVFYEE